MACVRDVTHKQMYSLTGNIYYKFNHKLSCFTITTRVGIHPKWRLGYLQCFSRDKGAVGSEKCINRGKTFKTVLI